MTAVARLTKSSLGWNLTIRERLLLQARVTDAGCWEWMGPKDVAGYPKIKIDGALLSAHRVAYEAFIGPLEPNDQVCHHCDNPPCIFPAHLFAGTPAENTADMVAKGRLGRRVGGGVVRLTAVQDDAIRRRLALGVPSRTLGEEYGVHHRTILRAAARSRVAAGRSAAA